MSRERIVITLRPQPSDEGRLKVVDAMQQVIDLLKVVEGAASSLNLDPSQAFDWRLERAATNSPFTVVAVAEARDRTVDVTQAVQRAMRETAMALRSVSEQRQVPRWLDNDTRVALRSLYQRTLNGIASTAIEFDAANDRGDDTVGAYELKREDAESALVALRAASPLADIDAPRRAAYGELDGRLVSVGQYRGQPALQIVNPLYGPVWCVVPGALVERLGGEHTIAGVWKGQNVAVDGKFNYGRGGRLMNIEISKIRVKSATRVPLADVLDPGFTSGLDPVEYLNRLHDGSLA